MVLLPSSQVRGEMAGDQGMGTDGEEGKGRPQMQDSLARDEKLRFQYVLSKPSNEHYLVSMLLQGGL